MKELLEVLNEGVDRLFDGIFFGFGFAIGVAMLITLSTWIVP